MEIYKDQSFSLRSVKRGDEFDIAKNLNDKTISRNVATIPFPYKLQDAKYWIEKVVKREKKKVKEDISFVIEIAGEVVGSIGLHGISKNHKAEIGFWLARKFWGQGIMTEVVRLVTDYGFKKLKLKRIWAGVFSFNPASMKVLAKNGYQFEGVFRKDKKKGTKYYDRHMNAIVR